MDISLSRFIGIGLCGRKRGGALLSTSTGVLEYLHRSTAVLPLEYSSDVIMITTRPRKEKGRVSWLFLMTHGLLDT